MSDDTHAPASALASQVPERKTKSNYPTKFADKFEGREKRPLGDLFGLTNFGVNLTRLKPGATSALRHAHSHQDEFIYILEGHPVLFTNGGGTELCPGMCAGFKAGSGDAHHLVNRTDEDVVYIEMGDRTEGDVIFYPDDDIQAEFKDGHWTFAHKDGTPY